MTNAAANATLASWLAARTPPAPGELRAHMRHELARAGTVAITTQDTAGRTEALVQACDAAFTRVLESSAASRDSALDLLSADAFVTYAFEAAADDPATISTRADAAMRLVSARAVEHFTPSPTPGPERG